jgi:hypothetical protein
MSATETPEVRIDPGAAALSRRNVLLAGTALATATGTNPGVRPQAEHPRDLR